MGPGVSANWQRYCDSLGIPVRFVVDANPHAYRQDRFWEGVDILGLDDVGKEKIEKTLLAICVGKSPYTQVVAPLQKNGWVDIVPFYSISAAYLDRHPLGNGWFTGDLSQSDIAGIKSVLLGYADNISRAHHLQFLAWHRLHEEWFFDNAPVFTENRYFIPEVLSRLHDTEFSWNGGSSRKCGDRISQYSQSSIQANMGH